MIDLDSEHGYIKVNLVRLFLFPLFRAFMYVRIRLGDPCTVQSISHHNFGGYASSSALLHGQLTTKSIGRANEFSDRLAEHVTTFEANSTMRCFVGNFSGGEVT
jgi:hypothetical protein